MRYEPVSKVMHLAIRLAGARSGLTINDIETEFDVSRRTAERLHLRLTVVPGDPKKKGERAGSMSMKWQLSGAAEVGT